MNINEIFPRRYATAEDIGTREIPVTISGAGMEQVGPVQRLVLRLVGSTKGIVTSATLARQIADIIGDPETDNWTGKKITLHTIEIRLKGVAKRSIRAKATLTKNTRKEVEKCTA